MSQAKKNDQSKKINLEHSLLRAIGAHQEGKIEEMGDADQIYNAPATPYTQKLIDAIPEGKLEDIKRHLKSKGMSV